MEEDDPSSPTGSSGSECIIPVDQIKLEPEDLDHADFSVLPESSGIATTSGPSYHGGVGTVPVSRIGSAKMTSILRLPTAPVIAQQSPRPLLVPLRDAGAAGGVSQRPMYVLQPVKHPGVKHGGCPIITGLPTKKGMYDRAMDRMLSQTAKENQEISSIISGIKSKDVLAVPGGVSKPKVAVAPSTTSRLAVVERLPQKLVPGVTPHLANNSVTLVAANAGQSMLLVPSSTVSQLGTVDTSTSETVVPQMLASGLVSINPDGVNLTSLQNVDNATRSPSTALPAGGSLTNQKRNVCGLVFNSRTINPDGNVMSYKEYLCNYCQFKHCDYAQFSDHFKLHVFACNHCSFKAFTRYEVVKHKRDTHPEAMQELQGYEGFGPVSSSSAAAAESNQSSRPENIIAEAIPVPPPLATSLSTPVPVLSPVLPKSPIPEKPATSPNAPKSFFTYKIIHSSAGKPQIYECDICQFQAKYLPIMYKHASTHTMADLTKTTSSGTLWECYYCSHRALLQSDVVRHLTDAHPGKSIQLKRYSKTTIIRPKSDSASAGDSARDPQQAGTDDSAPDNTHRGDPDAEIKNDATSMWGCYYCSFEHKDHFATVTHVKSTHAERKLIITRRRLGTSKKDDTEKVDSAKNDSAENDSQAEIPPDEIKEEKTTSEDGDDSVDFGEVFPELSATASVPNYRSLLGPSKGSKYEKLIRVINETSKLENQEIQSVVSEIKQKTLSRRTGQGNSGAEDDAGLAHLEKIMNGVEKGDLDLWGTANEVQREGLDRESSSSGTGDLASLSRILKTAQSRLPLLNPWLDPEDEPLEQRSPWSSQDTEDEQPPHLTPVKSKACAEANTSPRAKSVLDAQEMPSLEPQVEMEVGEYAVAQADVVCLASMSEEPRVDHSQLYVFNRSKRLARCNLCNTKMYGRQALSHMREHVMIHTGEKLWQCPYCNFRCNRRYVLFKHVRKIHPGQAVTLIRRKPYERGFDERKGATVGGGILYKKATVAEGNNVQHVLQQVKVQGPRSVRERRFLDWASKVWSCAYCSRTSVFRGAIHIHMKTVHPDRDVNVDLERRARPRLQDSWTLKKLKVVLHRVEDASRYETLNEVIQTQGESLVKDLDVDEEVPIAFMHRVKLLKDASQPSDSPSSDNQPPPALTVKAPVAKPTRCLGSLSPEPPMLPLLVKTEPLEGDQQQNAGSLTVIKEKGRPLKSPLQGKSMRLRAPLPVNAVEGTDLTNVELQCRHCVMESCWDPVAMKDHLLSEHPRLDPIAVDVRQRYLHKSARVFMCPLLACNYAIYHPVAFLSHLDNVHPHMGFSLPMQTLARLRKSKKPHAHAHATSKDVMADPEWQTTAQPWESLTGKRKPEEELVYPYIIEDNAAAADDDDDDIDWDELERKKKIQMKRRRKMARMKSMRAAMSVKKAVNTQNLHQENPSSAKPMTAAKFQQENTLPEKELSNHSLPEETPKKAAASKAALSASGAHSPGERSQPQGSCSDQKKDLYPLGFMCRCLERCETLAEAKEHLLLKTCGKLDNYCNDLLARKRHLKSKIYFCMLPQCDYTSKNLDELDMHEFTCPHVRAKKIAAGDAPEAKREVPGRDTGATEKGGQFHDASHMAEKVKVREDDEDKGHGRSGTDKMYQCSYCTYMTTVVDNIRLHVLGEHTSAEGGYTEIDAAFGHDGRVVMNVNGNDEPAECEEEEEEDEDNVNDDGSSNNNAEHSEEEDRDRDRSFHRDVLEDLLANACVTEDQ